MAIKLEDKKAIVAEVNEAAQAGLSAVVADARGVTVGAMTGLRKEAREAGVYVRVVRNTLLKRAEVTVEVNPDSVRLHDLALNRLKALRALCPDLSVTYDTKMAQLKGENERLRAPENRWLFAEGHVKHLHVNDTDMEHIAGGRMPVLHIGDGCVRFDAFFQLVREAAFSGSAVVESTSTRPDGSVDTDKMNQSLRRVREALNG